MEMRKKHWTKILIMKKLLLCVGLGIMIQLAFAQSNYPQRTIRIISPTSPGSGSDIVARLLAQGLSKKFGKPVIVENRVGAGTMIGSELVAKANPDGYTLLLGISTLAINPSTFKSLAYDAIRDFAPITQTVSASNLMVIHPSMPVKTVKEFIHFAKSRPGEVIYASAGFGTNPHLAIELFASMAKIKMVHVPYQGDAPSIVDLIGGHVTMTISPVPRSLPLVLSGRLKALGLTSATRLTAAPKIPTIAESGLAGYEAVQWYGLLAPANTPHEIINTLYKESVAILKSSEGSESFSQSYMDVVASSPEQFAQFIKAETLKWSQVSKAVGIVPQ